jgi:hypothetical protein
MKGEHPFNIPIIGADAELQARMRTDVQGRRTEKKQRSRDKVSAFNRNSRKNARYDITVPVTCFPVLDSREVSDNCTLVGIGLDIGVGGMKVLVDNIKPHVGMEVVVAIEFSPGDFRFRGGIVVSTVAVASGHEMSIDFRGFMHEVFENEHIIPQLDRDGLCYGLPYSESVLASLCKIGAATSVELDRMLLCPNCQSIPTFRFGCSLCLSSNVKASRMIHHFACANVDFVEVFEQEDELCCPKCLMRRMIIGSDYEYLEGPKMCFDCGQANLEKIQIGHCLSCENRFPAANAYDMKVMGYRVTGMDILAFINSQR